MGGIHSVRIASGVGLAVVLVLGCVPEALAETGANTIKAHIDIPEIGRTLKQHSGPGDQFAWAVDDEGSDPFFPVQMSPFPPEAPGGLPGVDGPGDSGLNGFSTIIRTAPAGLADPSIGLPTGAPAVPGPAAVGPIALLALGAVARRRRR